MKTMFAWIWISCDYFLISYLNLFRMTVQIIYVGNAENVITGGSENLKKMLNLLTAKRALMTLIDHLI